MREFEADSLESSRSPSPAVDNMYNEAFTVHRLQKAVNRLEIEHERILRDNMQLETETKSYQKRLESKDVEIARLNAKVVELDQAYAAAAKKFEDEAQAREDKLMSKLIDEVREQTDLRLKQEKTLGTQEEKVFPVTVSKYRTILIAETARARSPALARWALLNRVLYQ